MGEIVAAGFYNDAKRFLEEFVNEKSCEFKVFAALWRKKNFSFIFMGRENSKEMAEFTNEIFTLSSSFLVSSSFLWQVGSVYLLYGLYRNQILQPPVPIRMVLSKFKLMKFLYERAIEEKLYSLHYILDYLFQSALDLVANPTILGPQMRFYDHVDKKSCDKSLQTHDYEYSLLHLKESGIFKSLHDDFLKYEKLNPFSSSRAIDSRFTKLLNCLENLILEQPDDTCIEMNAPSSSLSNIPSSEKSCRSLVKSPNVRGAYSFPDFNEISDVDDPPENNDESEPINTVSDFDNPFENDFNESESLEPRKKLRKSRKKLFEPPAEREAQSLKFKVVKKGKQRGKKTRSIREYYEKSPKTNSPLKTLSSAITAAESMTNSEELLASAIEEIQPTTDW